MMLQNTLWPDYFGRRHVGAIRGAAMPAILLVGGIGAPAAGYIFDIAGSYDLAWWISIGLMTTGALLLFTTPKPRLKERSAVMAAKAGL